MPNPTPKKVNKPKEKKRTSTRRRSPTPRKRNSEPKRYKITNSYKSNNYETESMAYKVGFTELQPYAWITLKGDEDREAIFYYSSNKAFTKFTPTRHGLKSIKLINEVGKYPKVEFSLYVPDYRKLGSTMSVGTNKIDHHPGRPLEKFKIGARFDVKWGYSSSHTIWKDFRVIERDIAFEEGTAILSVVGLMGSRLLATTSSEVFTNTYGFSAVDQITKIMGLDFNKSELLGDELLELYDDERFMVTQGGDLGQAMWADAQKIDVQVYFNPELNELRFSTPFKYELVKRGMKPLKMIYGFPASMISSIDVETKFPKKRGTAPNLNKGNTQFVGGATGDQKPGSYSIDVVVAGPLLLNGKVVFIGAGRFLAYLKNQGPFPYIAKGSNAKDKISRHYEGSNLYVNDITATTKQGIDKRDSDEHYFQIIKKLTFTKDRYKINTRVTHIDEYNTLYIPKAREGIIGLLPISFNPNTQQVTFQEVTKPDSDTTQEKNKSEASKKPTQSEPTTTTIESKNKSGLTAEGEELKDEYVWEAVEVTGKVSSYEAERGHKNYSIVKDSRKQVEETLKELKEQAGSNKDKYQIKEYDIKDTTKYKVQIEVKKRKNPAVPEESKDTEENTSDSAPDDSSSGFKPASFGDPNFKSSKKIALTTITIKLKAGDWSMRIGRLIEIVDLYKTIDGVYYISKEEHTVDTSGFNTSFECKRASKKMVNNYGKRFIKGKGSKGNTKDKNKDTRQEIQFDIGVDETKTKANTEIAPNDSKADTIAKDSNKPARGTHGMP